MISVFATDIRSKAVKGVGGGGEIPYENVADAPLEI